MSEPFYPRLLRLKNIHPNAWQRALFGEGAAAVGFLLSPGSLDVAPWKTIVVLPLAVAAVVKAHDVLTGLLAGGAAEPTPAPRAAVLTVDGAEVPIVLQEAQALTEDELYRAVVLALGEAEFAPAPEVAPEPEPAPHDGPTSAELWAMVEEARGMSDDGDLPFVLVTSPRGPIRVGADVGGLLTAKEQAGALRAGLEASRPDRAVLVYEAGDGVRLAAYERGRAALVGDDLAVLTAALPPLL